jgi:aryl-alcohol dehydrogenase-like predicted oxidoreductase
MKNIRLGRSELEVSPIAFGTWQLGGDWGATDEEAAVAAMRRAADSGIKDIISDEVRVGGPSSESV